jgi:hypothetical protein
MLDLQVDPGMLCFRLSRTLALYSLDDGVIGDVCIVQDMKDTSASKNVYR